ncbi:putative gustatory receptor 9a [Drosophila montana]|uniref:putative gustatory receptor 9a n=1 Tax=Drosophila montana TaxID=40370 RepID=UPI00313B8735
MASRTEHFLAAYFRLLALTCSSQKRAVQRLLSGYLALNLGDMVIQFWHYFGNGWQMNNFQQPRRQQFNAYAKIIDAMSVAYLLAHMLMVLQALLLRNRERRLLAQLPTVVPPSTLINVRLHATLECVLIGCALTMGTYQSLQSRQLLPNLRYFYTTQAVRARYLQMALLVVRLDGQLLALEQQLVRGRGSSVELRARYAHIVRLAHQLSRLYGLSVLMMNVLCIGDFIVVCYAYIILWQLTNMNLSWLLLWQTIYVVLPTLIKICTLCAVCDKCAKRSQQLLVVISGAWRQETATRPGLTRTQTDEFSLQIMQNSVQFDVCGMYHLSLKTMAGMFLFILNTLVTFLQFVQLTKQQSS